MKRAIYTLALAFVLAGIVHILIILLIPAYAAKDAWTRLEGVTTPWKFTIVAQPGGESRVLSFSDPAFGTAACRYELDNYPVRVTAAGHLPFWSVAIFDRQGRNIYSFNDRTAIEQELALLVVNPVQMAQIRKAPPPGSDKAVLVESSVPRGFVLIRALQENDSWAPDVRRFLDNAKCEPFVDYVVPEPAE